MGNWPQRNCVKEVVSRIPYKAYALRNLRIFHLTCLIISSTILVYSSERSSTWKQMVLSESMRRPKVADRIGQQFGNYRLVTLLGQGGYAEVYLGQHVRLDLQAAIKVLHTHLTEQ